MKTLIVFACIVSIALATSLGHSRKKRATCTENECEVCGDDSCLANDGSTKTVGGVIYKCATAPVDPPAGACTCGITIGGAAYSIAEGSSQVINCNTWACTAAGTSCSISVSEPKCTKSDGSCVVEGERDGCVKECQVSGGSFAMGVWKINQCLFADGSCVPRGEGKYCYLCEENGHLEKIGCTASDGSCLAAGASEGCKTCQADFTFEYRCEDQNGNCVAVGDETVVSCITYECQNNNNVYHLEQLSRKCLLDDGSCASVGDFDGCNKECVAMDGAPTSGQWKYTKCRWSDDTCLDVGATSYCFTCTADVKFERIGCMKSDQSCVAVGEFDGCNECQADYTFGLSCSVDDGATCIAMGGSHDFDCVSYECQTWTTGGGTTYGLQETSRKCKSSDGSCLNTGDVENCNVCQSDGTFAYNCKRGTNEDGSDDCVDMNSQFTDGCTTYQCATQASTITMMIVHKDCSYNGSCVAEGPIANSCNTCGADGHVSYKCSCPDVSQGGCYDDGAFWTSDSCVKYKCYIGTSSYGFQIVARGCNDSSDVCHEVGDLIDGCTCVEGGSTACP